jgi:hypothetical protein
LDTEGSEPAQAHERARIVERESPWSTQAGAEPEGRHYNFFDELDDRLAGLGDEDHRQIAE